MATDVPGTVYLLHFDQPVGDTSKPTGYARHYTGWTTDLPARLAAHAAGRGARLMEVITQAGISWSVARTWPGTRERERQLKRQGGASRHCPACKALPAVFAAARQVTMPAQRQAPEPKAEPRQEPLWESMAARLEPAEAGALLRELDTGERDAWAAATPAAGAQWRPRMDVACDISRLRNDEASAAERLAEALAIAQAEGWAGALAPDGRPFDRQAAGRPEVPRAQGVRVKEEDMFKKAPPEMAAASERDAARSALAEAQEMNHPVDRAGAVALAGGRIAALNAADRDRAAGSFAALLDRDRETGS